MLYKFLAFSFLLSLVISGAEARTKPDHALKEIIPHGNPWDPRYSEENPNEHQQVRNNPEKRENAEDDGTSQD
jgi:hypothetical protein